MGLQQKIVNLITCRAGTKRPSGREPRRGRAFRRSGSPVPRPACYPWCPSGGADGTWLALLRVEGARVRHLGVGASGRGILFVKWRHGKEGSALFGSLGSVFMRFSDERLFKTTVTNFYGHYKAVEISVSIYIVQAELTEGLS